MRVNSMKDHIVFYKETQQGPYPGMGGSTEVFKSWAEIYEPSTKDFQIGSLETSKVNITVIIRNAYPEFVPNVNNTFVVETRMYQGIKFNIKSVSPKDANTIKVVGTQWE